ncbi:TolC family protein [Pedobacter arcticus]|uniref:TolC family protein n=1 Tax=Pedobacter arcticus TaxID=752140 RepID=UPI00031EA165|nr:TolC family protein [Pedobacter arcticus]
MKYSKLKLPLFVLLAISVATNVFAQGGETVTLKQAVDIALQNNLQIKQAQFQSAITDENLKQSKFELYPSLNSSFSANKRFGLYFDQTSGGITSESSNTASGNLSTDINLFSGFRLQNQILQNKALLASDQSNVEKVKNDLSLSVVNTYLQILNNQDLTKASEQQLSLSQQQLGVAQKNFKVGNNTQADLSQAQAQVANNELSLTNAQNAFELSMLNLKQLMEMDPERNITLQVPVIENLETMESKYSGYEVYSKAVTNYPDIKAAEYSTKASEFGVKIAKGGLYPTLSFGGQLYNSYSSNAYDRAIGTGGQVISTKIPFSEQLNRNFGQALGFNLSIPIFNNYRSRSSYNIAKIRFENAKASEQLVKNNLNKVVNQAVQDLKSAIKSYSATQSAFNSSKDAFNAIKQRYDVGLANVIELNTSQTNYNKAEFDFIQAKYNVIFRKKVIDFYLGNPLTL